MHLKLESFFLFLLAGATSGRTITENRFDGARGSDAIQVTRCDIACYGSEDRQCHRACMREPFVKKGRCPDSFENVSPFVQACVEFCTGDNDCPATDKCCEHSCGFTCKPVSGLEDDDTLPEVPIDLTASKRKGVYLSWRMPDKSDKGPIVYVLEERHHLGKYYNELLLGEWNPIHSTRNLSVTLKSTLQPGHFYQFRVASVNVNGSKGFSPVSKPFTLAGPPKIQKPKNLRVEEISERNGTVSGTVRWKPSKSSIPIDKYKILWSFKLDEDLYRYNSDSLLTQRSTVPENRQYYQLRNLLKNKLYYIQVQAVANYGRNSLRSGKAQMVLDTSIFKDQYEKKDKKSFE